MPALDRIRVEGFKSIRTLDLPLGALNVMIGANGSGKSNLIGVFRLLHEIVNRNLQVHSRRSGGADTLLHFGRRHTTTMTIELEFVGSEPNTANLYGCSLIPTGDDVLAFSEESAGFHDRNQYAQPLTHVLERGHRESVLTEVTGQGARIAYYVNAAMQKWRVYHFHDTSDSSPVKAFCDVGDNRFLRPDAANLAAFLYWLQQVKPEYYLNIVDTIRLVAPFFDDFTLQPDAFNPERIRLEWRERGSDSYFNAHALSDGTLRFICMATLLLQPESHLPSTILLDEPELGLHPYALGVLADLLQQVALKTQLLISTQSVTLVNQFAPDDLIVVERKGQESVFRRLNDRELAAWLDEYALGELWEKNLIGGRPAAWRVSM